MCVRCHWTAAASSTSMCSWMQYLITLRDRVCHAHHQEADANRVFIKKMSIAIRTLQILYILNVHPHYVHIPHIYTNWVSTFASFKYQSPCISTSTSFPLVWQYQIIITTIIIIVIIIINIITRTHGSYNVTSIYNCHCSLTILCVVCVNVSCAWLC